MPASRYRYRNDLTVANGAKDQQPRPAIVAGRLGDIVANHGAAQGTTGVDDEDATVTGSGDGLGDEGIVFEDLQCHDRPQKDRRPP